MHRSSVAALFSRVTGWRGSIKLLTSNGGILRGLGGNLFHYLFIRCGTSPLSGEGRLIFHGSQSRCGCPVCVGDLDLPARAPRLPRLIFIGGRLIFIGGPLIFIRGPLIVIRGPMGRQLIPIFGKLLSRPLTTALIDIDDAIVMFRKLQITFRLYTIPAGLSIAGKL